MKLIEPHPEAQFREAVKSQMLCGSPFETLRLVGFSFLFPLYVCPAPRKSLEQTVTHLSLPSP